MKRHRQFGTPLRLLAIFVLLSAIPLAALAWLGRLALQQDRELETRHQQERLQDVAGALERQLKRSLAAWDDLLRSALERETSADLPTGAALFVFDGHGVVSRQGRRLPYYPVVPPEVEAAEDIFAAAEDLEIRAGDLEQASFAYRNLAEFADRRTRAGALMRLARALRAQNRREQALLVYEKLAAMAEAPVSGAPSELVARAGRITLFKQAGNERAAMGEGVLLASALADGRYLIDGATFDFYSKSVPAALASGTRALDIARALDELWPDWPDEVSGRKILDQTGAPILAVWRRSSSKSPMVAAMMGDAETVIAPAVAVARDFHVRLTLEAPGNAPAAAGKFEVLRTARDTGFPWTVRIGSLDGPAADSAASRRYLLSAGFALIVLVITAAGYFVFRSVSRELSVARLQSDFVAAVSHEFRTPLTAMCHLTEMLEEGGVPSERLFPYHRALKKESRRLHQMVESLLDFGRMEAGRRTYHMEETNAAELVSHVVEAFHQANTASAQRLEWTPSAELNGGARIRGDREALALALRNLIDNAIKYSPEVSTVCVSVNCESGLTGISVQDHGAGIPRPEQRQIFKKFVRGSSAKNLNVKGTGIGLTMANEIVRAHGGRLELSSQPGHGSRFTILLPNEIEATHE